MRVSHVVLMIPISGISYIQLDQNGGGGRIRTSEGFAGRFTVCSLWPLGNPTDIGASGGTRTPGQLITNQ
jgi:hypothetical protein